MTVDKPPKGQRKKYYGKPKGDQRGAIKGAGIFITTPRGLENRAVREAYDIFDDIAERLYPDITPLEKQHDGAVRDIIEDAMEDELQRLQKKASGGGMKFQSRKTLTDCLSFITVEKPYDPVKLVEEAITELLATKTIKSKAILRLTPVAETCYASDIADIEALARKVLAPVFRPLGREPTEEPVRFKVLITFRNHTKMDRMVLLPLFVGIIRNFVTEPNLHLHQDHKEVTQAGEAKTPSLKQAIPPRANPRPIKVDLEDPEKIVLVDILRNTCGISVVNGPLYEGAGKRFNMDQIGRAIVEERGFEEAEPVEETQPPAAAAKEQESETKMVEE